MFKRYLNYWNSYKSKSINNKLLIRIQNRDEVLEHDAVKLETSNTIYKFVFKAFLFENRIDDTPLYVIERNDKLKQFYFKEFLYYKAEITSEFWGCQFGKNLLRQIENEDDLQENSTDLNELLGNYKYFIYSVYGNISLDELLNLCDDVSNYFYP